MTSFIFLIALIITGIVQAWNGEWITALELWALGWILVQANNSHMEAMATRNGAQKIILALAELKKKSPRGKHHVG